MTWSFSASCRRIRRWAIGPGIVRGHRRGRGRAGGARPRRLRAAAAAWSRSPRSIGATASRTTPVLSRPRPLSTSGASTSMARRRASSSTARCASARLPSGRPACWARSPDPGASSRCRSASACACLRQRVGLVGLGGEDVAAELGRLLEQGVEVTWTAFWSAWSRSIGASARAFAAIACSRAARSRSLARSASRRPRASNWRLQLVEPWPSGGEPMVGLAKVAEARAASPSRRAWSSMARLDSASTSAICRAGARRARSSGSPSAASARARSWSRSATPRASLSRLLEGLPLGRAPTPVAALRRVGGVAKLLGLATVLRRRLLDRVELACSRWRSAWLCRACSGSAFATIVSDPARRPRDVRPARGRAVVGHPDAVRRACRPAASPSVASSSRASPRAGVVPRPGSGTATWPVSGSARAFAASLGAGPPPACGFHSDRSYSGARPRRRRHRRGPRPARTARRPGSTPGRVVSVPASTTTGAASGRTNTRRTPSGSGRLPRPCASRRVTAKGPDASATTCAVPALPPADSVASTRREPGVFSFLSASASAGAGQSTLD